MESIQNEQSKASGRKKNKKKRRPSSQSDGSSPALKKFNYGLEIATQRTYMPRLRTFFTSIGLNGSMDEQAEAFLKMAKENGAEWVQDTIMDFFIKEKSHQEKEGLAVGTVENFYYPIKTFMDKSPESSAIF